MVNKNIDILVVSSACHTAINRKVYSVIQSKGYTLRIVVPDESMIGGVLKKPDPPQKGDPPIDYERFLSHNSRYQRVNHIHNLLNKYTPRVVVIDNDPVSIMTIQIGMWANKNSSKVFCITCENLSIGIVETFRRRGLKGLLPSFLKNALLPVARKYTYGVFTISDEGTEVFCGNRFKNVTRIPLGFDPEFFYINSDYRAKIRNKYGLNGKVIGYFGRVTYKKGLHVLMRALSILDKYDWTLLLDEFDEYHNEYVDFLKKHIIEYGLENRVVYVDPGHSDIAEYMNGVDVVVMPSISTPEWVEQYGRVAPEAMACGKLVIVSRTGALPMLIQDYGILVSENDEVELADVLRQWMECEEGSLVEYSAEEIKEYAHTNLSIEAQAVAMLSYFESTGVLSNER